MTINTKFNIGDTIYYLSEVKPYCKTTKVRSIEILCSENNVQIKYRTQCGDRFKGEECFKTKEELINTISE